MKKPEGNVYYTLHNLDGTKETKIASIKDVYVLLNDKMEYALYTLEKSFDKKLKRQEGAILFILCVCLGLIISLGVTTFSRWY